MRRKRARRKAFATKPLGWSASPGRPTLAGFVVGIVILSALVGLFGWFGKTAVSRGWFEAFDAAFAVVPDPDHLLTDFFVGVTWFGTHAGVITLTLLMLLTLLVRRSFRGALAFLFCYLTSVFVNDFVKDWVGRPRPEHLGIVEAGGFSYMSGHAYVCTAAFGFFAYLLCRGITRPGRRIALVVFTVVFLGLIGYSRIYLGVHYASDVAAGFLLGIAWIAVWAKIFFPSGAKQARR